MLILFVHKVTLAILEQMVSTVRAETVEMLDLPEKTEKTDYPVE